MRASIVLLITALLAGCSPYSLVRPARVPVAFGSMLVTPTIAWNKVPNRVSDGARQESWTQNGQALDNITFIGGLADGEALAKQQPNDTRKVPVFRASMTPQDLVSMVESYYRIRAGAPVFSITEVKPTQFLGSQAVQVSYDYVLPDKLKRRGRMVLAIIDKKLYAMSVVGATTHYFDAALPEFETLASSAVIRS